MKLLRRHYYILREFFRSTYDNYFDISDKELTCSGTFYYYKPDPKSPYVPMFGKSIGKHRRVSFPRNKIHVRSLSTLIREAFRGGSTIEDSNGNIYHSASGIITDHNFVPIIYVELDQKHPTKRICVINSYVFRRENILSKFIVDTLIPLIMNPSYRKSLFEDDYSEPFVYSNMVEIEVVFKDITADFWNTSSLGMILDNEKIANFTEQFCHKLRLSRVR